MNIQSPTQWGARVNYDLWNDARTIKDKIIIHYNGPAVRDYDQGVAVEQKFMRVVETYHLDSKGWRGFAYGWGIGFSGTVYRARGWNNYGAHTGDIEPDGISENKEGIPVFFILGEGQEPSPAMWQAFAELKAMLEADTRSVAGSLPVYGHRDVASTACPGDLVYEDIQEQVWRDNTSLTRVMGVAIATEPQAVKWAIANAHRKGSPYSDDVLRQIVRQYYQAGAEYGVRADLALAQSAKETGYWAYGGLVRPDQWNFAGIGATGGVPGITYPSIEAGVRSHVLRMRMYAVDDPNAYDPSVLVRPLPSTHWGKYPFIENFNGVWAVPGLTYGQSIVNDYLAPMLETVPDIALSLEDRVRELEIRVLRLETR